MGSVTSVLKTILKCAFQPESKKNFLCGRFPFHLIVLLLLLHGGTRGEVKRSARHGGDLSQASRVSVFFKWAKHISEWDVSKLPPHSVQWFLPVSSSWHKIAIWYPLTINSLFLKPQCSQTVWRTTDKMELKRIYNGMGCCKNFVTLLKCLHYLFVTFLRPVAGKLLQPFTSSYNACPHRFLKQVLKSSKARIFVILFSCSFLKHFGALTNMRQGIVSSVVWSYFWTWWVQWPFSRK